jgi:monofunctional biosynthetic peptidoglycan transglycosylase
MLTVIRRVALGLLVVPLLVVAWLFVVWPPPAWWRTHWPAETAFMRMREGQFALAGDTAPLRYRPVPLDSITVWLERAATAGEDDAFFLHHGIDYRALRKAIGYRRDTFAWGNRRDRDDLRRALRSSLGHRDRLHGASTITQQLAKNLYLSPSRNPLRKLKEAAIAYRLEWALPKSRILELYLNVAEFGPNLWGVEAASQRYFGRGASRLSMDQAALLIATLPHPLTSNPAYRPGRTRWRQQLILRRLRGEPVEVPAEPGEELPLPVMPPMDTLPFLPDTMPVPPPNDTTAVPAKPDTAVVLPGRLTRAR